MSAGSIAARLKVKEIYFLNPQFEGQFRYILQMTLPKILELGSVSAPVDVPI